MKGLAALALSFVLLGQANAQEIPFRDGQDDWNADSLGNQRAVVDVAGAGKTARVSIPWRRSDAHPENKRIIVQDGQTGNLITNVHSRLISSERGDIEFEPASGKGKYYIYYMPYKNEGRSNYPKGVYPSPVETADAAWLKRIPATQPYNAKATAIESINAFNSFYRGPTIWSSPKPGLIPLR
jgi:hypothetical protein